MQADSNSLSPYWLIFCFALGIAWICLIFFLVRSISGWHKLSKRFRAQSEPYGGIKSAGPFFYSVYMRYWSHYGSAIRITAADGALYLSVFFLLRVGLSAALHSLERNPVRQDEVFLAPVRGPDARQSGAHSHAHL